MNFQIEIFHNGEWTNDPSLLGHGCTEDANVWLSEAFAQDAISALVDAGFNPDRLRVREIA